MFDGVDDKIFATLVQTAQAFGATVRLADHPESAARFVGTFTGHEITLFPNEPFLLYFTIAHLYGHMVQLTAPTPRVAKANVLVQQPGTPLSQDDVQLVYEHEHEAACIGRALIGHSLDGCVDDSLDRHYSRLFFADFAYLVGYLETAEGGPDVFARYLHRQPLPHARVRPDERPLIDLRLFALPQNQVIVI